MIRNNYHTHTFRCGHAVGEDEEYVLEAIGAGFQSLGFSDHIMLPNIHQENVRGDYSLLDNYVTSIRELEVKYKERIKIYLGFEAEPLKEFFPYYQELLSSGKIDYMILGNHCYLKGNELVSFFSRSTSKDDLIHYKNTLIEGMRSGLFLYVAHPDYFMGGYSNFDRTCKMISEEICDEAIKLDMPLEFNFAAIRRGKVKLGSQERYLYPHIEFWKIAKKKNVKVILGLDAHGPKELTNVKNDLGIKMAKDLGLNIINKLEIKSNLKR